MAQSSLSTGSRPHLLPAVDGPRFAGTASAGEVSRRDPCQGRKTRRECVPADSTAARPRPVSRPIPGLTFSMQSCVFSVKTATGMSTNERLSLPACSTTRCVRWHHRWWSPDNARGARLQWTHHRVHASGNDASPHPSRGPETVRHCRSGD